MSGNMTNTSAADMKMKQLSKKFRVTGLTESIRLWYWLRAIMNHL